MQAVKGAKALWILMVISFVLGALTIAFHPAYRGALTALWSGTPETSPILQSNAEYYPHVAEETLP